MTGRLTANPDVHMIMTKIRIQVAPNRTGPVVLHRTVTHQQAATAETMRVSNISLTDIITRTAEFEQIPIPLRKSSKPRSKAYLLPLLLRHNLPLLLHNLRLVLEHQRQGKRNQ